MERTKGKRRKHVSLEAAPVACDRMGRMVRYPTGRRTGRRCGIALERLGTGGEAAQATSESEQFWIALAAALPPDRLDILVRYIVLGWSVEELGRVYGKHKATISRWIHRALGVARSDAVLRAALRAAA